MTTNGYAAKRAIIGRLKELAGLGGGPLSGVQVEYAWPGNTAQQVCVYGGAVEFAQPGDDDLVDGAGRLVKETATITIHISVADSPPTEDGIQATDEQAEAIGEAIGGLLLAEPRIAGGHSVARIVSGRGDYSPTDDQARSVLSYRISIESYLETTP